MGNDPAPLGGVPQVSWPPLNGYLLQRALLNRPAVLNGAARACPAWSRWTDKYLSDAIGDVSVQVEVSQDQIFANPERKTEREPMKVRDYLSLNHMNGSRYYLAQTSMDGEMLPLAADVPLDNALSVDMRCQKMLWLSRGDCVTPLHYDGLQNLFVLFSGRKRFTLFSPQQSILLYPANKKGKERFSLVNVERADAERFPLYRKAEPLVIDLEAGDALFIPAGWWHHVRSFGRSLAVSLWWSPVGSSSA